METKLDYNILNDDFFPSMSQILLNHCLLKVDQETYRLVEIEYYLHSDVHPDPYVHCNPDQLLMHCFYFHKFGTGTYKAGTFKGMDLTFGDLNQKAYFGILVRSIENIKTGELIEGPCNVVNKILHTYHCESIIDFTNGDNLNMFENDRNFIVVISDELEKRPLRFGPRFGLSKKYPEYQNKNYRYTSHHGIKKAKSTLILLSND